MKFLFAFVFFIIAVYASFFLGSREWQIAFIGIATVVGFMFGKMQNLSKQIKELREILAKDLETKNAIQTVSADETQENVHLAENESQTSQQTSSEIPTTNQDKADDYLDVVNQAAASVVAEQSEKATDRNSAWSSTAEATNESLVRADAVKTPREQSVADESTAEKSTADESIADKISAAIKGYFSGGNIFVRIGIIILFFGVSFLLKYVSDRGFFPIEYRLISVVLGAMFLLGLGWRLRHKNETYALLLQGAGIGILYLDIFAAYNLYQLIPPIAAFVLLFVVSLISAALAVMQDAKSLAVLGFSGGFLAPILASSGSNNHVGLFSYYAVLNVAIVAIAWFKAWRELNLLGFAFTFIIGTVWGVLSYNSTKFASTEPFLILFFLFYVLIAMLYALRQPPKLRGYVDGTLLFGVPLAASGLQYYLVKDSAYGVSISSFVMGAFYLLLARFIWQRKGDGLKLLAEAFLALGVIFASMAIPFALAPTQTAAAWALEGAGFIWLGSRQNRLSVRGFGVLLQIAAGFIFLWRFNYEPNARAFLNAEFISSMMLAVAGIVSARLLIKPFAGQRHWEKYISPALLVWGLMWLVGDFGFQLSAHFSENYVPSYMILFTALLSLSLGILAVRSTPIWKHAMFAAFALFSVVVLMALLQFVFGIFAKEGDYHPSIYHGGLAWLAAFAAYYCVLYLAQKHALFPRFQCFFHTVLLVLAVFLITIEGRWWLSEKFGLQSAWLGIWMAIPATITMWKILKVKLWPFGSNTYAYKRYSGSILAFLLGLWSFIALVDKGSSAPLPWIPVLNPSDVMLMIVFITLYKWWQSVKALSPEVTESANSLVTINRKLFNKRLFVLCFAGLAFLWLNFTLFRVAHHWFEIPWNENAMYASNWVQTSVSILWAFTGVILTLFASRKSNRLLWVIGALLLGLVVLKLFVIDLSALGSLGRVVSFLVVGALLTSIGYFAPLPDKNDDVTDDDVTDNPDSKQTKAVGNQENA